MLTRADQLRALADDVERYARLDEPDLLRAVGIEIAVVGAEIMAAERRDAIGNITINLTNPTGGPYAITEQRPRRGGPLRRLAARLQRHQREAPHRDH